MRAPIKALVKIAVLPNYRPSGFDKANVVWGRNGLCPTITTAFAKANQPMIFVREEDEEQDNSRVQIERTEMVQDVPRSLQSRRTMPVRTFAGGRVQPYQGRDL